jgi:sec-independent protein translocase protein TatB
MLDIGAPEFLVLLVLAVILFGPERLPDLARKAARVIRYIRTMANNAQEELGRELGPGFEDIDVRDLNPKTFIQKHLLDDVEPIVKDVKADLADATSTAQSASRDVTDAINGSKSVSPGGPSEMAVELPPARALTPYDPDAT